MSELTGDLVNLEAIRIKLGMSRRQICKLLKVDPSAWTRWMKSNTGAPQYVHQALNWYVQLVEQNPNLPSPEVFEKKLDEITRAGEQKILSLKRELQDLKLQGVQKKEAFDQLGNKLQESFENVLVKFRDQMAPLKTLEVESLKYENIRLKEHVQELAQKMKGVFDKLEGLQKNTQELVSDRVRATVRKNVSIKKITKLKKKAKKMLTKQLKKKPKKRTLKKNAAKSKGIKTRRKSK